MRKYVLMVACFMFFVNIPAIAQYVLDGFTFNQSTKLPIDSVKVVLEKNGQKIDSTFVKMTVVNNKNRPYFRFENIKEGHYMLYCYHPMYETFSLPVEVKKNKSKYKSMDYLYLKQKNGALGRILKEVKVKATRIKLFYKGDTIIYDADAFNLAHGSMLEALIEELPGVQLKSDGQIYVQGRKVDELLLNGKNFFRGDRLVLLENLPSYMVKNVKVYEKDNVYRKPGERKTFAMDVMLKKQYMLGWISNAECGGGTTERFLGKMFGLRFTNHSRLSLFGNINNVNDNRKPGRTGEWQPTGNSSGRLRMMKSGIDYYTEDPLDKWNFNTSNEVTSIHQNLSTKSTHTTFLPEQNTFRSGENLEKAKNILWLTRNTLILHFGKENRLMKPLNTEIQFNMSYYTFNSDIQWEQVESNMAFDSANVSLQNLLSILPQSLWYSHLLNRSRTSIFQKGYDFKTDGSIYNRLFTNGFDALSANLSWAYRKNNTTEYNQRYIDYPAEITKTEQYYHRYTHLPIENYELMGDFRYTYFTSKDLAFIPRVECRHTYNSIDKTLFELQQLGNWGIDDKRCLTELPSTRDSLQLCYNVRNSYYSRVNEDKITLGFNPQQESVKLKNDMTLQFDFDFPLDIIHTRLHYLRGPIDTTETRCKRLLNPRLMFALMKGKKTFGLNYSQSTSLPSLVYRLNIIDDEDPLYITTGNSSLRNTTVYNATISFWKKEMPHFGSIFTALTYQCSRDAMVMSLLYNSKTGGRMTCPNNVNGNWNLSGNTDFTRCMGSKDRLTLDMHTKYTYLHSVDLTGTMEMERSVVKTFNLNEDISLKYKINKNTFSFNGKFSWSNVSSDREDFKTMNIADFSYGFTALFNLPRDFQFTTDLTMFSRRGYELNSMNTNDLVWNARLSRTFLKGNLTCFVDGFDILGNLSNIYRSVNAQGRTETRYNVVPRYIMLHVIYRLNVQPKKKVTDVYL
jgi:hypothetical protein